jgi:hypothetical protein
VIARTPSDRGMVNLQLIRFSRVTRLQTDFVNCVLPNGTAARAFMREYFKRPSAPPGLGIVAASVMDDLTCYWDWGAWDCTGGIYCQASWSMRVAPTSGPVHVAQSSMQSETGTFHCTGGGSDGCWINVQDYGGTYAHTWGGTCDDTDPGDGDPPGGGGDPPTSPTPAEQISALVALDPWALLAVPCGEIPKWLALATMPIPQSVTSRLALEPALQAHWYSARIQTLQSGVGPIVNMDYYAVTVPIANIPNGLSVDAYLNHVRTNINSYVDPPTRFNYYVGLSGEEQRWTSSAPLGTVFSITLHPVLEDGSVVTTDYDTDHWVFSTVTTPMDRTHPVSGNREFGAINNGNGTATIYTRGTDRVSTRFNDLLDGTIVNIFDNGHDVWVGLQRRLKAELGVTAVIEPPVRHPVDYDKVRAVLAGHAPVSTLQCSQ